MTEREKEILPELIEVAKKLTKESQETLIRLGNDILFIDKVKHESRI